MVLALLRDLVIVVGAIFYNYRVARFEAAPLLISKLNTLLQIVLALLAVIDTGNIYDLPDTLMLSLIWSVAFTTLVSGVIYVSRWGKLTLDSR